MKTSWRFLNTRRRATPNNYHQVGPPFKRNDRAKAQASQGTSVPLSAWIRGLGGSDSVLSQCSHGFPTIATCTLSVRGQLSGRSPFQGGRENAQRFLGGSAHGAHGERWSPSHGGDPVVVRVHDDDPPHSSLVGSRRAVRAVVVVCESRIEVQGGQASLRARGACVPARISSVLPSASIRGLDGSICRCSSIHKGSRHHRIAPLVCAQDPNIRSPFQGGRENAWRFLGGSAHQAHGERWSLSYGGDPVVVWVRDDDPPHSSLRSSLVPLERGTVFGQVFTSRCSGHIDGHRSWIEAERRTDLGVCTSWIEVERGTDYRCVCRCV